MKQIDLEPKHVRRVVTYRPWFFWYVGGISAIWIAAGIYAFPDIRVLWLALPFFCLGLLVGVRFRDTP